jgi:hypothetical protein
LGGSRARVRGLDAGSAGFSIADPNDRGMLDVVGIDSANASNRSDGWCSKTQVAAPMSPTHDATI